MLLCFTQTFPIPHLHISPHPLNRKEHQRPWSDRDIFLSTFPRQFIQPRQGARGGLGLAGSRCPLGSIPCSHGLAFFLREFLVLLSVREWVRFATGTACLKNVLTMWWSGVIWTQYIFHVGFSAGHPFWRVLPLSDSTLEHHVVSRWCQPHTVPAYHLQTFICFSGLLLYENVHFLFLHSQGHQKHMVQEDLTPYVKFCLCTNFLKLAFILGPDNAQCEIFFKHSRVYCLERYRFISQLETLWIYHLEEGNLYMRIAGSILCLLGLLCNYFINWNMILVFLKSEVLGKNRFLFSPESW